MRLNVVLPMTVTRRRRPCHETRSLCLDQTVIHMISCSLRPNLQSLFSLPFDLPERLSTTLIRIIVVKLVFTAIFNFLHRIIWPSGLIQYQSACPCTRFWQHLVPLLLNADVVIKRRERSVLPLPTSCTTFVECRCID